MRNFGGRRCVRLAKSVRRREQRAQERQRRSVDGVRNAQISRDDLYEYRVKHALRELGIAYEFQRPFCLAKGFFVVDFYFPRYHLAIEVDGGSHLGRSEQDRWRIRKIQENYKQFRIRRVSTTWMNAHSWDDLKQLLREWLEWAAHRQGFWWELPWVELGTTPNPAAWRGSVLYGRNDA